MSEFYYECHCDTIYIKIWTDWRNEYFQIKNSYRSSSSFDCYILGLFSTVLDNYSKQNSKIKSKKIIKLCNNTLIRFLKSGHPATQDILDYASVCNWQKALIELKKVMPKHEEKASSLNLEELYLDLKSMNKIQQRERILKYTYSRKLYFNIAKGGNGILPETMPFYTAISQGQPDFILEAFIKSDYNINEQSLEPDLVYSGLCLESKLGRFKIASLILKKIIKNSGMLADIDWMDRASIARKYPLETLEIIQAIPADLPSFKTFEDRLEFIYYLQYSIKAIKLKTKKLDPYVGKILQ